MKDHVINHAPIVAAIARGLRSINDENAEAVEVGKATVSTVDSHRKPKGA